MGHRIDGTPCYRPTVTPRAVKDESVGPQVGEKVEAETTTTPTLPSDGAGPTGADVNDGVAGPTGQQDLPSAPDAPPGVPPLDAATEEKAIRLGRMNKLDPGFAALAGEVPPTTVEECDAMTTRIMTMLADGATFEELADHMRQVEILIGQNAVTEPPLPEAQLGNLAALKAALLVFNRPPVDEAGIASTGVPIADQAPAPAAPAPEPEEEAEARPEEESESPPPTHNGPRDPRAPQAV